MELCFRTDNGCQFTSFLYQRILKNIGIQCTKIPKATHQLNGHIEAFHSTIERLVCKKYSFINLKHARDTFGRFYNTYNEKRIMKAILSKRKIQFFNLWREGRIGFSSLLFTIYLSSNGEIFAWIKTDFIFQIIGNRN